MTLTFSIEPNSGCLCIGELILRPFQTRAEIEPRITHLIERSLDHRNGYEWLYLGGLSFGGQPAIVALCFHAGRLEHAGWNVSLPNATEAGGWPARSEIDAEVSFVRNILAAETGSRPNWKSPMSFDWGEIWSHYDARADCASHGLRYRSA